VTGGWQPPTPGGGGGPPPPAPEGNTIAHVGFALTTAGASILGLWFADEEEEVVPLAVVAPLSLALAVTGTICAWIARERIRRGGLNADPMWPDVGLAVGGVCTVFASLCFLVVVLEALS
jgi:hypothetical protein